MRKAVLAMTAAAMLSISGAAGAATTITNGSYTLSDDSFGTGFGVHSNGTQSGSSLDAHVNIDGSAVTFSSTDGLSQTGKGEAIINGPFDNLDVNFAKGWDSITFAFDTEKKQASDLEIFIDGSSTATFSGCSICTLASNGEQKFTISGPSITELYFTFSNKIDDAKQFRVEGATAAPEPATWAMMLMGVGMVGGGMRIARRNKATALTGA